jgi:aminoglycoside phosphotransferase (APT) family kinase protein
MTAPDRDEPDPAAVIAAFGLDDPVTDWTPADGAWSNRVYRLGAGGRRYAVKEMRNPWADPHWQQWLAESWVFEQRAIAAGVAAPQPVPNPANGNCLARVSRRDPALPDAAVRVHHWVDGNPVGPGPVEPKIARSVGQALATLHGLEVRPRDRSLFPVPSTDTASRWPELAEAARRSGAAWARQLTAAAPAVSLIADLATSAGYLPDQEVITHGDVDQKNLIATTHGPVLCDWDLAAPLVPRRELADVAMSMGCWDNFAVSRDVVRSYRQAGGDDTPIEPSDLGQPLMIALDWVAFNVERAIGLRPATAAETVLARKLAPELLAAIPDQVSMTMRISDILNL